MIRKYMRSIAVVLSTVLLSTCINVRSNDVFASETGTVTETIIEGESTATEEPAVQDEKDIESSSNTMSKKES